MKKETEIKKAGRSGLPACGLKAVHGRYGGLL